MWWLTWWLWFSSLTADLVVASLSPSCHCTQPVVTKNFLTQPWDVTHSSSLYDSNTSISPFSSPLFCPLILTQKQSGNPAFILHPSFVHSLACSSWVFYSSSTHSLHLLLFLDYHQDYRFSVGCDWVPLGVMWALRCLLNGEHHELWPNYRYSSTTLEPQWDMRSSLMRTNICGHAAAFVELSLWDCVIDCIYFPFICTS